jgi:hypothetical protein
MSPKVFMAATVLQTDAVAIRTGDESGGAFFPHRETYWSFRHVAAQEKPFASRCNMTARKMDN